MNILIVGAGIAGLVAARALHARGHAVTVVERAKAFAPVGAGIILSANAMAILDALAVDARGAGRRLDRMDGITDAGRSLSVLDLAAIRDQVGDVYAFHRAELHAALARAAGAVALRLGVQLTGLTERPDGVEVDLDGAAARYDLVLGCDGLRSAVRAAIGQDAPLRYSGETCWRCVVPAAGLTTGVEAWGDAARFGVVPLTDDRAYLFLVRVAPAGAPTPPWPEMEACFGRFAGLPARVWPAVRPDDLVHHDLFELPGPVWGTPRVWLVGDAAHGMTPNLGQGAGMAIEDVAATALCLDDDLPAAHARWVALRHARVAAVQLRSRRFGQLASLPAGLLRAARDLAVACTPTAVGHRGYRALVAPGLDLAARLGAA